MNRRNRLGTNVSWNSVFWLMISYYTTIVSILQSSNTRIKNDPKNNGLGGVVIGGVVFAYTRKPCTRQVRPQFQFPDCYVPSMNPDLKLSSASFVFSHDAATGYIHKGSVNKFWWYSKNQIGGIYQQLNDGARAFDLRPKLVTYNDSSTEITFQHGDIRIPVTLQRIVQEAIAWCRDNPDELVLFFMSHFQYKYFHRRNNKNHNNDDYYSYNNDDDIVAYDDDGNDDDDTGYNYDQTKSLVTVMGEIFQQYGVNYVSCGDVYDLTVGETMELAELSTGGYLLALDGHEEGYASFCAKSNYVEDRLVTCYPNAATSCTNAKQQPNNNNNDKADSSSYTALVQDLKNYVMESINNGPTDDESVLGAPSNLYQYPFNEAQGIWQVTPASVVYGMARFSNILDDNTKSRINEHWVSMIYDGQDYFRNSISLFAIDNVHLNGNAILSVLRNTCGQSLLSRDGYGTQTCGQSIPPPRLTYWQWSNFMKRILITFQCLVITWILIVILYYNYLIRGRKKQKQQEAITNTEMQEYYVPGEDHNKAGKEEEEDFHPRLFFTVFASVVQIMQEQIKQRRTRTPAVTTSDKNTAQVKTTDTKNNNHYYSTTVNTSSTLLADNDNDNHHDSNDYYHPLD